MSHPYERHEKAHRHHKQAKLGVKGEHPDHKAERLCRGGYSRGGSANPKPVKEPNPAHLKGN